MLSVGHHNCKDTCSCNLPIAAIHAQQHLEALIYNRHMVLREDLLRNSIANLGDPSRIQALFRKLLRGRSSTRHSVMHWCVQCAPIYILLHTSSTRLNTTSRLQAHPKLSIILLTRQRFFKHVPRICKTKRARKWTSSQASGSRTCTFRLYYKQDFSDSIYLWN